MCFMVLFNLNFMESFENNIFRIFIGYDPVEKVAWHTLAQSIINTASVPVAIIPLNVRSLKNVYERKFDERQSNEFSFTRFLVPYLSGYKGWSLFMDCDMMLRRDVAELIELCTQDKSKAVYVVKHDYTSKISVKYLNKIQYSYPRKNWSSFVLWNNEHVSNKVLDVDKVNSAEASFLHRFSWLEDDVIGELPVSWNWLVGEYEHKDEEVYNVHWTLGGPYFNEFASVDFADDWRILREEINYCKQRT